MTLIIDKTSYPSPNYDDRPKGEISSIVLHDGEGSKQSDLERLTDDTIREALRVSAHYYVDRALNVYQLVDPVKRAWHAGNSSYQGRTSYNDFAIGIETEHKQGQPWAPGLQDKIAELSRYLISTYSIKEQWIVAHKWIAKGRKFDPTNWPDDELHTWVHNLYVQPTTSIEGLAGPMACGQGFYDFYHKNGAFAMFGFALTAEAADVDTLGRECTWMRFERTVFKYVYGEGVHLALLVEAASKKWLL